MEEQLRQMKIRSSEEIALALDKQNKTFRAGYDSRLQAVSIMFCFYYDYVY